MSTKKFTLPALGLVAALAGGVSFATFPTHYAAAQAAAPAPQATHPHRLPSDHVDGRIAYLKAELKITNAQQAQWGAPATMGAPQPQQGGGGGGNRTKLVAIVAAAAVVVAAGVTGFLVLGGDKDDTAGRPEALAAAFPQGESLVVPGRDHMSAVGDPMLRRLVATFLAG